MTRSQVAENVVDDIKVKLGRLTKATIAGYIISATIAVGAGFFANANREAVCALQGDLGQRIASGKQFLAAHPNGAPELGFSAADIEREIMNEEQTRASLDSVPCF
jgi:hypothetical protein